VSLQAQAPTVRDSAGIRIVTNPALAAAPETFRFNPTPILDVGGLEEVPYLEFKSNQGYLRGTFLSDGSLVVTDETRLHFFDPQGRRLGVVGSTGAGPKEFRYIIGICRTRGDTTVVFDSHNARNVVIAPTREIVRTFPSKPNGALTFSSCFDDGTVVLSDFEYDRATQSLTTRYQRGRLDGTIANRLVALPPIRYDMVTGAEVAIATAGQRFYLGAPGDSEIKGYDAAGRLQLIVRMAGRPERITDAKALERMSYAIPAGRKPTEAEIAAAKADGLKRWKSGPHAEYWPTYGRIHADDRGRLWVNQFRVDNKASSVWVAFAADGRMLGKLVLAPELQVIDFWNNGVLVRAYDDDGATYLRLHAIGGTR
jgi:hypothetical protein